MKVATAAHNTGSGIQDRTRVSSAHDSSDDLNFYFFRVTNFSKSLWLQPCTEPSSSKGDMEAFKAIKLHAYHKTLWAYLSSSTTISKGGVCRNTSMCDGPHPGFFQSREAVYLGDDQWSCPNLPARTGVSQHTTIGV
jgi:hypothetical protein